MQKQDLDLLQIDHFEQGHQPLAKTEAGTSAGQIVQTDLWRVMNGRLLIRFNNSLAGRSARHSVYSIPAPHA